MFASSGDTDAPYEQCRIMPSAALFCLVKAGSVVERCA